MVRGLLVCGQATIVDTSTFNVVKKTLLSLSLNSIANLALRYIRMNGQATNVYRLKATNTKPKLPRELCGSVDRHSHSRQREVMVGFEGRDKEEGVPVHLHLHYTSVGRCCARVIRIPSFHFLKTCE